MGRNKKTFALDVVSIRLVKDAEILSDKPIHDVEDLVALLGEHMCELDREVICVVNLKSDGTPINCHYASVGAINYAIAHPRELFKSSILSNAANMILLHNHVSGSLQPSKYCFIFLIATGPHEPFSMNATLLFWKFLSSR